MANHPAPGGGRKRRQLKDRRRPFAWGVVIGMLAAMPIVLVADEPQPPAAGAPPAARPAQPAPAKPPVQPPQAPAPGAPQVQVQIQVQAGPGGGKVQIQGGGAIQIQGNAVVQIQANGAAVPAAAAPTTVGENGEVIENTVFRTPDRTLLQRLAKSESLIQERRYAEAVEMLGGILEQPEDYFFRPDRNDPRSRSMKGEARRRLGLLPPEGRDAYELQYGVKAGQMLDTAIETGDETALAETSRRYFHTAAGLRATYLLGLSHLDRGRPLAAALCLSKLRDVSAAADFEPELSLQLATAWARAGVAAAASTVLEDASRRYPGAVLSLGGTLQRWPAGGAKALAWLAEVAAAQPLDAAAERRAADQWLLTGGDSARNAVSPGSNPLLNRRWAVPYVNHPDVEKLAEQLGRNYAEQAGAPLPASQPLAVGDVILMRTLAGLTAIDFRTGKRIWRGATDERLEQVLSRDTPLAGRQDQEAGQLAYLLEERLWHDEAYGTLSSDGRRVFCVEQELLPGDNSQRSMIMFNGRRVVAATNRTTGNRLAAYDLATEGKLLWELGGSPNDADAPSAATIYLGPPLPLGDRLYAMAETKGELRLLVLESATGKLDWSQQLAVAPEGFDFTRRRTSGLSPTFADGVLVCPTSLGAVVAVDLNDRSLLWGFQYKQLGDDGMRGNRMFMWQMQAQQDAAEEDRWHDALVAAADGKVLVAPPDGDQLCCLNLLDGSVAWQKPRDHGLYLGCVVEGRAVVVAAGEVRAYHLADGKQAWKVPLPDGAKPSGRGFFNGRYYFVPLNSAEVAAVDVAAGEIAARSRSRSGNVPGNLVCYRGAVLSQGPAGLECFYQLDELRRDVLAKLQAQPNDPRALASQGELLLDEGKTAEAVASLRKAYAADGDDPRTRNLLIDALLEGLGSGVAAAASDLEELEKLASGTVREETYLRLRAEAHEKAGDDRRAFDVYLRLVDLPGAASEPVRISSNLSIGREQRVKAKLQALFERADARQRTELESLIAARREQATSSNDPGAYGRYLEYFGHLPGGDELRLALAELARHQGNLLEAENLLRIAAQGDDDAAAAATAQLAELLVKAGRPREATAYLDRLDGEFAERITADGKIGRQVVQGLLPAGREALERRHVWPSGKVEVAELRQQVGGINRTYPLEFRGPRGAYFADQTVEMDQSQQGLVGRNALGIEQWRVSLGDPQNRRPMNLNPSISHVRADGHLLMLSLGYEIVAIDVLGGGPDKPARVLWRVDLTDSLAGLPGMQNVHPRVVQMPWGVPRFMAADPNGRPIGTTGPVTPRYASFIKQRALHVVDPLSGKVLWIRHDVDPGSDLFGDDDYLFVTPTGDNQNGRDSGVATVYRTADGEKVNDVKLPRPEQRVASFGRRLLAWTQENGKAVLKLVDGLDGRVVWSESFTSDAKLWPIDGSEAAVFTRAGKLTVLGLADGAKRLEATVMPEPQLSDAFVFRTDDSYLLVTNSPLRQRDGVNIQPVPGGFGNPLINGYVYGFDRGTGKQTYRTRVAGHGLTLNQPSELPMLVFASQRYEQLPRGQMRSPEAVFFCIDKRTGRTLYDRKLTAPLNMVDLVGEPDRNAMVMKTLRNSLRFTFTDEPVTENETAPAKSPTQVEP